MSCEIFISWNTSQKNKKQKNTNHWYNLNDSCRNHVTNAKHKKSTYSMIPLMQNSRIAKNDLWVVDVKLVLISEGRSWLGMRKHSEVTESSTIWSAWWLHGCIHMDNSTELYMYSLCALRCIRNSSI